MKNEITVKELAAQPVLSIRVRTKLEDLPRMIGENYGKIMAHLNAIGVQPVDAPYTAYYNMDMNDLDVEMGFPLTEKPDDAGELKGKSIPACRAVNCMYKGSYGNMEAVYNEIFGWMGEQGLEAAGVYYEYYYNSPHEVPESELLTRIVIPVK